MLGRTTLFITWMRTKQKLTQSNEVVPFTALAISLFIEEAAPWQSVGVFQRGKSYDCSMPKAHELYALPMSGDRERRCSYRCEGARGCGLYGASGD